MTTTNGPATATVETLRAEVRVLQVGSRQITLSVVKQLDRARYEDIEPMGRVRSGRRDDTPRAGECGVEVVGRHRDSGALVFGYAPTSHDPVPQEWLHWLYHAGLEQPQWRCEESRPGGDYYAVNHYTVIDQDGHRLEWAYRLKERHCTIGDGWRSPAPHRLQGKDLADWQDRRNRGEFCDMPALETAWRETARGQHAASLHALKLRAEAEALPLIVLAGLR
jgi:hypothetical protein